MNSYDVRQSLSVSDNTWLGRTRLTGPTNFFRFRDRPVCGLGFLLSRAVYEKTISLNNNNEEVLSLQDYLA